jgi:hypothetical protein
MDKPLQSQKKFLFRLAGFNRNNRPTSFGLDGRNRRNRQSEHFSIFNIKSIGAAASLKPFLTIFGIWV